MNSENADLYDKYMKLPLRKNIYYWLFVLYGIVCVETSMLVGLMLS